MVSTQTTMSDSDLNARALPYSDWEHVAADRNRLKQFIVLLHQKMGDYGWPDTHPVKHLIREKLNLEGTHLFPAVGTAIEPAINNPILAVTESKRDSVENDWRKLALQFDGHRMQALSHLRTLLANPETHAGAVTDFLSAAPLTGEAVLTKRIAEMAGEAQLLSESSQTEQHETQHGIAHSLGGFRAGFQSEFKRKPTEQEIWNHAIRSWRDLNTGSKAEPVITTDLSDNFKGSNATLVGAIQALLSLDAANALTPHGVGGHARTLLTAASVRLAAPASEKLQGLESWLRYTAIKHRATNGSFSDADTLCIWADEIASIQKQDK